MSRMPVRESRTTATVPIVYFGKIPSRGDFVKSHVANAQLVNLLDRWAAQALELMAADARWKLAYDAAPALRFAFLGAHSRLAIGGCLTPSRDASDRRFPFIAASAFEVDAPLKFIARAPLALARCWSRLDALAQAAVHAADAATALSGFADAGAKVDTAPDAYATSFADFAEIHSIGTLEALLDIDGRPVALKRLLPALGVLLQPLLAQLGAPLDKSLVLPLPHDALYQPLCAAYWLELLAPFIARSDVELAVIVTELRRRPSLIIGFDGASPRLLEGALHPSVGEAQHVVIDDAAWIDAHVAEDSALRKLVATLERPQLSLAGARATFLEVFIGA